MRLRAAASNAKAIVGKPPRPSGVSGQLQRQTTPSERTPALVRSRERAGGRSRERQQLDGRARPEPLAIEGEGRPIKVHAGPEAQVAVRLSKCVTALRASPLEGPCVPGEEIERPHA